MLTVKLKNGGVDKVWICGCYDTTKMQEYTAALEQENAQLRESHDVLEIKAHSATKKLEAVSKELKDVYNKMDDATQAKQLELNQAQQKIEQQMATITQLRDQIQINLDAADLDSQLHTCRTKLADYEQMLANVQMAQCELKSENSKLTLGLSVE